LIEVAAVKVLFTQQLAVLLQRPLTQEEIEELLREYSPAEYHPMQWHEDVGKASETSILYRPELKGACFLEVVERGWTDDLCFVNEDDLPLGEGEEEWPDAGAFPGALARALTYSSAWPEAEEVVPTHSACLRLRLGYSVPKWEDGRHVLSARDPADECSWLLRVVDRILDSPASLCYFNPVAELLLEKSAFREALRRAGGVGVALQALTSIRFTKVEDNWMLADTVGMAQLGLPDHEFFLNRNTHDVGECAAFPLSLAIYLLKNPGAIRGGHTADGPGGAWRAEEPRRCLQDPPRKILRWCPIAGPLPPLFYPDEPPLISSLEVRRAWPPLSLIRERAAMVIRSSLFYAMFHRLHPQWWMFVLAVSIQALRTRKTAVFRQAWEGATARGFATPGRRRQYLRLSNEGEVLLAHLVIMNSEAGGGEALARPALVLGSFDLSHQAQDEAAKLARRLGTIYEEGPVTPTEAKLEALLRDDRYREGRRRSLPLEATHGLQMFLFDILIFDGQLPPQILEGAPIPCLAQHGPSGQILMIPWDIIDAIRKSGTPPPLPGGGPPPLR
jgi:hypothetical protein